MEKVLMWAWGVLLIALCVLAITVCVYLTAKLWMAI